jgi:hypothetical protein
VSRNTVTIAGLLLLVAAYASHERLLFVGYHVLRIVALLGHHRW